MVEVSEEALAGLSKAISDLVPKKEAKKEEPAPAPKPAEATKDAHGAHKHKPQEGDDGSLFCTDCNSALVALDKTDDALIALDKSHDKHGNDFLNCPTCRGSFVKMQEAKGYRVEDRGDELRIKKKS